MNCVSKCAHTVPPFHTLTDPDNPIIAQYVEFYSDYVFAYLLCLKKVLHFLSSHLLPE